MLQNKVLVMIWKVILKNGTDRYAKTTQKHFCIEKKNFSRNFFSLLSPTSSKLYYLVW